MITSILIGIATGVVLIAMLSYNKAKSIKDKQDREYRKNFVEMDESNKNDYYIK